MKMKTILWVFVFFTLANSCVIDKMPSTHITVNDKSELKIDSIILSNVSSDKINMYKLTLSVKQNDIYERLDSIRVTVFIHDSISYTSNQVECKTLENNFELRLNNHGATLIRQEMSLIVKWIIFLLLLLIVSFGCKAFPSLLFVKPINKKRYLLIATSVQMSYSILLVGGYYLFDQYKSIDTSTLMLCILLIGMVIDILLYRIILAKNIKVIPLISGVLLTTILYYVVGISILMAIHLSC